MWVLFLTACHFLRRRNCVQNSPNTLLTHTRGNYTSYLQTALKIDNTNETAANILLKFQQTLLASALNCRRITVATVKCGRMLGDGEEDGNRADKDNVEGSDIRWRGCSMDEIYRQLDPFELEHVAAVKPSENHTVLHHFPIREDDTKPPRPLRAHHKWDALHVRLPCSNKSQYPVMAEDGSSTIENRWEMIEKALLRPIKDSHDLQDAILSYNTKYEGQWNFRALHKLFEQELDEDEASVFFEDLLPRIIRLALRMPELVQAPIPLLKQWKCHALTLTQEQISCLLANAFLCTYPRRNTLKTKSEYSAFPDINFNRLFQSSGSAVLEKLKCICHYFRRVCPTENNRSNVPTGCVTFERRNVTTSDMPNWPKCCKPLGVTPLHITSEGTIEDQGVGLLQVDFANKFLGGGVLGCGCVQEEIRFVICPELIVSKLFTECLRPSEALIMMGCERFSNYTGYANTFQWDGNHVDNTPRDSSRRRLCHIVAIDALNFHESAHQYREELMLRELNKAYVGFFHPLTTLAPGVASGNWGCGAFGGEATLKALLQLMVCTVTGRPLVYFTFGNDDLRDEVHKMHTYFIENNILVKDLWFALRNFQKSKFESKDLYRFLYTELEKIKRRPEEHITKKISTNEDLKMAEKHEPTAKLSPSKSLSPEPSTSSMKAKRSLEESLDVFASTSSEAENSKVIPPEASILDLTISDEDDLSLDDGDDHDNDNDNDDAKQVASTEKACEKIKTTPISKKQQQPKKEAQRTPAKTPSPVSTKPRQRTLLEMLDQTYNQLTTGPATKRYCVSKPSQQQKEQK